MKVSAIITTVFMAFSSLVAGAALDLHEDADNNTLEPRGVHCHYGQVYCGQTLLNKGYTPAQVEEFIEESDFYYEPTGEKPLAEHFFQCDNRVRINDGHDRYHLHLIGFCEHGCEQTGDKKNDICNGS
ncbi:hypothetical protein M011DRAFT_484933 [Sporormia fimetaria CBS 119925]|uniref:Uncharacterized protein n=1 Tax=Sporormia fimetaria CBS 119925 TaxID=1340428 RepID=A0A6A6VI91_9PLEO|nr:hypothetical protein M011DRAFT_484933 [Sporormia fimetaria CBS 119925]